MDRPDLSEQLEVFRPRERESSPDVSEQDPSHSARLSKIQAHDAVIGRAVRNVEVPAGLQSRILQQTAVQTAAATLRRRRNVMIGGLTSALVLSLLVGISIWRWPDKTWTSAHVSEAAAAWYGGRQALPAPNEETPPLPRFGFRDGLVAGYDEIKFLKKSASAFRLASGPHEAIVIVVDAGWFPKDFDPADTYFAPPDGVMLEVRFRYIESSDQYCIVVGEALKPFEEKGLIF